MVVIDGNVGEEVIGYVIKLCKEHETPGKQKASAEFQMYMKIRVKIHSIIRNITYAELDF